MVASWYWGFLWFFPPSFPSNSGITRFWWICQEGEGEEEEDDEDDEEVEEDVAWLHSAGKYGKKYTYADAL